jgi:hypothetical protein
VYRQAERLVLQDAPLVPLFHPLSVIAVQADVRGLNVTPMGVGNLSMEKVWLATGPPAATVTELGGDVHGPERVTRAGGVAATPVARTGRPAALQGRVP